MNEFYLYEAINEIDDELIIQADKKKNHNKIWRYAAVFAVIFSLAVSAFAVNNLTEKTTPTASDESTKAPITSGENVPEKTDSLKGFPKADYDDYGEDGLEEPDVIVENVIYRHISKKAGVSLENEKIPSDALGDYVGEIAELTEENGYDSSLFKVSSHSPKLVGAKVYYYLPTENEAVLAVVSDSATQLFTAVGFTSGNSDNYFKKMFELYGVKSASDIKSIECDIWKGDYDSENTAVIEKTSITSKENIEIIFDVLLNGEQSENQDISVNDPYSVTMELCLSNGLIVGENGSISYMPYNSTGHISCKGIITAEENEKLKAVFSIS